MTRHYKYFGEDQIMKRKMLKKITVLTIGVISIVSSIHFGTIEVKADTANGWNNEGGNWYYYENGAIKTGWFTDKGKWCMQLMKMVL